MISICYNIYNNNRSIVQKSIEYSRGKIDERREIMKLNDILTEEEKKQVNDLMVELDDCITERQMDKITKAIEEIFNEAKKRYYESIGSNKEQAASLQEDRRIFHRRSPKRLRKVSSY